MMPETKSNTKPEIKPEIKPETKPDNKFQNKPGTKSKIKLQISTQPETGNLSQSWLSMEPLLTEASTESQSFRQVVQELLFGVRRWV